METKSRYEVLSDLEAKKREFIKDREELEFDVNLDVRVNNKKLIEFVAAVLKSSYFGLARLPSDSSNASLEERNIKELVEGIQKYIKERD